MSSLPQNIFQGLDSALLKASTERSSKDVNMDVSDDLADQAADIEITGDRNYQTADNDSERARDKAALSSLWRTVLADASRGVSDSTDTQYQQLIRQAGIFFMEKNLVKNPTDFFCRTPPADADKLIALWIMNSCDTLMIDGTVRPASEKAATYATAQKMRAAMNYAFGVLLELGRQPWVESPSADGTRLMTGNPSMSELLAKYMVSLHRRKVQAGEVAQSARAINSRTLRKMYDWNNNPSLWGDSAWGGSLQRKALQCIYTLAFLCLLRSDEVLKIKAEHIVIGEENGKYFVRVTLPFRKTHQFGEVKPFVIWDLAEEEAHLCPVRALGHYLAASKINSGYLFRSFASGDRLVANEDIPMTTEKFLEFFRHNLLDIGEDDIAYGTHSFRRGGTQYLSSERRWDIRRICDWAGWSLEFTNLTIVKYLISWNDDPTARREDFFHPDKQFTYRCHTCGRSCNCA